MTKNDAFSDALAGLIRSVAQEVADQLFEKITTYKNQINSSEEYLTKQQAMELLGVKSPSTIHLWTNQGKITPYGTGAKRLYKKSELLRIA